MAGKGGARLGAGRKTKADEERVRDLAVKAIVAKWGSEDAGFAALLESRDPTLMKWVFEHGYGKPKDIIDMTTRQEERIVVDFEEEGDDEVGGPGDGFDYGDDQDDDDADKV